MGGDNYFGILRPHTELVSTNAVDNTDEFVAGTLYDLGAVVKVSAENNLYKCLTKDTTEIPTGNKTTENWLFLGKTNPHKMFDEKYKSRTIKESGNLVVTKSRTVKVSGNLVVTKSRTVKESGNLVVTIKMKEDGGFSKASDGIALLNVSASKIRIVGVREGETIYDEEFDMGVLDLFSPCKIINCNFGQIVYKKNLILTPLKDKDGLIISGCKITEYTITFEPIDDETPAACGVCILGKMQYFGKTLMNPKKSLVNYDVKDTNEYGDTAVVERGFSNNYNFSFVGKNDIMQVADETLTELRSTPLIYVVTDDQILASVFSGYGMVSILDITQQGACDMLMTLEVGSLA